VQFIHYNGIEEVAEVLTAQAEMAVCKVAKDVVNISPRLLM
jgi:hypothetical protein